MTVSIQQTVFPHVGNGVSVEFGYGCQVTKLADLKVYVNGILLTTGYTVSGLGTPTGGSVIFSVPPADGAEIILQRLVALERSTNYPQNGDFKADVVNADFDRIWMVTQQQHEEVERSIRLPLGSSVSTGLPLPTPRRALMWNAAGTALENSGIDPDAQVAEAAAQANAAAASATDAEAHRTTASRWATKTDGTVVDAGTGADSLDYSAKAYAIGGTVNPAGGSAKDWATKTSGEVVAGQGFGAKKYAEDASNSATAAAASAASINLPPATGNALRYLRQKSDESGLEYRTPAQVRLDLATASLVVALTDATTITPDFSSSDFFTVTLAGNRTLANPTNQVVGQSGVIRIAQDGTGGRTLAFGSNWKFPLGVVPSLTTAANAVDLLVYYVDNTSNITARLIADRK